MDAGIAATEAVGRVGERVVPGRHINANSRKVAESSGSAAGRRALVMVLLAVRVLNSNSIITEWGTHLNGCSCGCTLPREASGRFRLKDSDVGRWSGFGVWRGGAGRELRRRENERARHTQPQTHTQTG